MPVRILSVLLLALPLVADVPGIKGDGRYEVSLIDSDETEFFVSQVQGPSRRLFVGCREALFVYEPEGDGFAERQELFRFPGHSWLYDLEVHGDDLLVLCNTALYRIRGAVTKREGLKPEKLLWGLPQGHYHQGLHGLEFGPTGDLFISMGDPQPHLHWDRSRPDHLWHWTFFVGPENREVPYTGVGAILRYSLDDHSLSVHASGLRNPCGISFDPEWRLYANDNDQEGAVASPGKLVYAPRHSWHGWVRGWALRHNPARRDILPVTNLELDVPVGQSWHNGAVLVANWGNRTISRHPVTKGVAPRDVLLEGEGLRRPVSVVPLNDGRLVVAVCYMQGNEGSPVRKTDLLLLTPQTPSESVARVSDIYRAARDGDASVRERAVGGQESAIRAMAEFPATFAKLDVEPLLAKPELRHAVLEYLHAIEQLPPIELAADDDPFVRQSAAQLVARLATPEQLAAWAGNASPVIREAAVNAAGFAIWQAIETTDKFPKHREMARSSHISFQHPDGPVKLDKPVFIFMPSEWWKENKDSMAAHAGILAKALDDAESRVRIPAAVQLFFLKDPTVDSRALAILAGAGIELGAKSKKSENARAQKKALRALKSATLANGETIPAEFANQDWNRGGDAATGKELFTSRGCIACHLAPDDGKGGSIGPSLVDVHTRFSAHYLAESILLPNRFVSPNFHPTTLTMKDGSVHTGFIEKDEDSVALRIITGGLTELPAAEIAKRETSHQSMMPAGLVQSPKEMRHLLAYMLKRDSEVFAPLKANVYRFAPQQARFVRVELLPGSKRQPCIDEIEIFGPGSDTNLALAGKASASSLLKGYAWKHQIHFLNDGKYTNAHSWIPAQPTGWAQIELAESATLDRVVLSRDRGGKLRERVPYNFDIKLSADGKGWKTVKKVRAGRVVAAVSARKPGKPNIVLILADDFGWGDTSCNNPDSPIKTPAIDRIAQEGIRLTNAHTPSAVCTPTRYGLLTGRYPWRSYLKSRVLPYYAPALITKGRPTIASYLKSQGYRTGGFGKWHLGLDWTPKDGDPSDWRSHWETRDRQVALRVQKGIDHSKPFQNAPTDIGFDTYFGTASNCSRLPFFIEDNRVVGKLQVRKDGWLHDPDCQRTVVDDIYVKRAIDFMAESRDKPFFVYLPLNAIHGAVKAPSRHMGKSGMSHREDKIRWANESVAKILDALDQMGLADDTLLIFTSDNGPINSPVARKQGHEPTGPYRGLKTNVYEGGTRVPFLARWPGRIRAGATGDQLIGLTDVFATVAAVCGKAPGPGAAPDSHSFLPLLLQQGDRIAARPPLVTASYEGFLALYQGKWKAVFDTQWHGGHFGAAYGGPPPKDQPADGPDVGQLFDIANDPYETRDLWDQKPEIVSQLRQALSAIKQGKFKR